jgi:hypothetical protein
MPSSGYSESPPNSSIDRQADLPVDREWSFAEAIGRLDPSPGATAQVGTLVWSTTRSHRLAGQPCGRSQRQQGVDPVRRHHQGH